MKLTYEVNKVVSAVGRRVEVHLDPIYFTSNFKLSKIYAELQFMTKRNAAHNLSAGYNFYGFTIPAKFEGSIDNLYAKYNLYDGRTTVSNASDFRKVKVIKEVYNSNNDKYFTMNKKYLLMLDEPAIVGDIVTIDNIPRYVKYAQSTFIDMSGYWFCELSTTMSQSDLLPKIEHEQSSYDKQDIEVLKEELNALKNVVDEMTTQLGILLTTGSNGAGPVAFAGIAAYNLAVSNKLSTQVANVNVEINKLIKEIR